MERWAVNTLRILGIVGTVVLVVGGCYLLLLIAWAVFIRGGLTRFGWIKTVARQEKTKFRGRGRVGWAFTFAAAAYNLVRLPKLIAEKA